MMVDGSELREGDTIANSEGSRPMTATEPSVAKLILHMDVDPANIAQFIAEWEGGPCAALIGIGGPITKATLTLPKGDEIELAYY